MIGNSNSSFPNAFILHNLQYFAGLSVFNVTRRQLNVMLLVMEISIAFYGSMRKEIEKPNTINHFSCLMCIKSAFKWIKESQSIEMNMEFQSASQLYAVCSDTVPKKEIEIENFHTVFITNFNYLALRMTI